MLTIAAFIITIGILVTIHEYGHYQVAKWCGVKVLRFSIGFGKPLFRTTLGQDKTEFVLALIPLGGYVKMLDESVIAQDSEQKTNPIISYTEQELSRAFNRQSVWKRIAIVAAGPIANLLLAILIYWGLFVSGVTVMRPVIGGVTDNTAVVTAQLKTGDLIKKIDGSVVESWQDVRWILLKKSLSTITKESAEKTSEALPLLAKLDIINADNEEKIVNIDVSGVDKNDLERDVLEQLGFIQYQPKILPIIGEVTQKSVAERGGLKAGDKIITVNKSAVTDWDSFVKVVRANPIQVISVEYERQLAGVIQRQTIFITPEKLQEHGKTIGRIGAAAKIDLVKAQADLDKLLVEVNYSPFRALTMALDKTWDTSTFSLKMLGKMLTGQMSFKGISGPATIASYAGQSADLGLKVFLGFLATISISIGVLNLLPIPVLDGGHLLYYMVEIFKGSPVSDRVMEFGQRLGFGVLGLLMSVAIFNDITRFATAFTG
ncbi:MAG: RIP metalloprotease RseP [Methylophilaceae bacterium]|nr:RIP metalloprotease RseP [Methylophilaceae bacterium]